MWGKRGKRIEEGMRVLAAGIGEWKEREKDEWESVSEWMDDVEKKIDRLGDLKKELVELKGEVARQQASIVSYRDLVEQLLKREDLLLDRLMARNLKELKVLRLPEVVMRGSEGDYDLEGDEELAGSVLGREELEGLSGREMEES